MSIGVPQEEVIEMECRTNIRISLTQLKIDMDSILNVLNDKARLPYLLEQRVIPRAANYDGAWAMWFRTLTLY